jgi:dienelactone hydrolase
MSMSFFGPTHSLSPEDWLLAQLGNAVPKWSLAAWSDDGRLGDWRAGLIADLRQLLGLDRAQPAELDLRMLDRYEEQGVTVERLLYNSEAGVTVAACLLLPHTLDLPQPAVLLCHDRGPGKASALAAPNASPGDPGRTLARRLLDEKLIVMVPDAVCYGERSADEAPQAIVGAWLGRPLMGRWAGDVLRAVDVIAERQEVTPGRVAVAGLGLGGAIALHAMALDERLRAGIVSGQLCGWADRARALSAAGWRGLEQELPVVTPGLAALAELDDIAALCAPRPLAMVHASDEPLRPIEAARLCAQRMADGYKRLGGAGLFEPVWVPETGSRAVEAATAFLVKHLRAQWV